METIQELLDEHLQRVPRLLLEKHLPKIAKRAGIKLKKSELKKLAAYILSKEKQLPLKLGDIPEIEITADDLEAICKDCDRFLGHGLEPMVQKIADDVAAVILKTLQRNWKAESAAQQRELAEFRHRLQQRWGSGLEMLKMLLTIIREYAGYFRSESKRHRAATSPHYHDVMSRLLVRACQVTGEIIALLENGFADGAMARWRTLHEIATVAAVIRKFGDEIAERYFYYQIVESMRACTAYQQNYKNLGYRPTPTRTLDKIKRDFDKARTRFGAEFVEEYGWAAHHLKTKRVTFARLEQEAGDSHMRSHYKMASYNVHANPKGAYFKLGSLDGPKVLLAGASNAGLTEPAQNAAISLCKISMLVIGKTPNMDDVVLLKILTQFQHEIPREFARADRRLSMDHRRFSKDGTKEAGQRRGHSTS